MIHTLIKPSSFMTFYFADIPGCDIQPIMEVNLTDYEPVQSELPRPMLIHRGHGFLGRVYGFNISLSYNQSLTYLPS